MKRSQKRQRKRRTRKRGGSRKVLKDAFHATKDFVVGVGKGYTQNVVTGSTPLPMTNDHKPTKPWVGLNDENSKENVANKGSKKYKKIKI